MELHVVQIPADLLRAGRPVPLDRVGVEPALTRRAVARDVVAEAGLLVARPARAGAAVHGAPLPVEPLHVLHDVDLTDAWPVPPVAAIRCTQHPKRRPVPAS